jgi:uncharacterized membrane protein YcaP (DUF421 family)
MDLLLLVLIADAAQNAMAGEYHSISKGLVLCGTLFGWNFLLDWLAYRYDWVARLLECFPLWGEVVNRVHATLEAQT